MTCLRFRPGVQVVFASSAYAAVSSVRVAGMQNCRPRVRVREGLAERSSAGKFCIGGRAAASGKQVTEYGTPKFVRQYCTASKSTVKERGNGANCAGNGVPMACRSLCVSAEMRDRVGPCWSPCDSLLAS